MSYWGWKPYVPVAQRRSKAQAVAAKAKKSGATLSPVEPSRGAIARTFWGKAWCDNLERYSDYSNRLPRGRTYVRSGSVIDLAIGQGEVRAQVMGSDLYRVEVRVAGVGQSRWKVISADCAGSIDSMIELLQGTFSKGVMERLCRPGDGLFPAPKEIEFTCTCPDWASMCKHVAAVLYGVGARLDQQPELLFQLRRVDGKDLVVQAGSGLTRPRKSPAKGKVLDESALGEVFGIELAEVVAAGDSVRPAVKRGRKAPAKATRAAAKVVAVASTKASSPSKGSAGKRSAGAAPKRATATARTPAHARRQGAGNGPRGATRGTRAAPTGLAAKRTPKRKPRA